MWQYNLERMYQQWQQGNPNYARRYIEFVELVARQYNAEFDVVLKELEKYQWFKKYDT